MVSFVLGEKAANPFMSDLCEKEESDKNYSIVISNKKYKLKKSANCNAKRFVYVFQSETSDKRRGLNKAQRFKNFYDKIRYMKCIKRLEYLKTLEYLQNEEKELYLIA